MSTIADRFDQPGFAMLQHLEDLLVKAAVGEDTAEDFAAVTAFYKDDFDPVLLQTQLALLSAQFSDSSTDVKSFKEVQEFICKFTSSEQGVFPQVVKVLKLILVNPATNAVSERSFSAMRRVKTNLRSKIMGQRWLNAVVLLHVQKEKTDRLSLVDIANEFVNTISSEYRRMLFGMFTPADVASAQ